MDLLIMFFVFGFLWGVAKFFDHFKDKYEAERLTHIGRVLNSGVHDPWEWDNEK